MSRLCPAAGSWSLVGVRREAARGVFYVFAPIPMFAVASWGPVLACLPCRLLIVIARSLQPIRWDGLWLPAMSVSMCIPFVLASEVRVTGEAGVMTFLAVACATFAEWRIAGKSRVPVSSH